MPSRNPFERWGIDPQKGPAAITERMRELIEEAPDEETRRAIRAAWEELTVHPARRFRAALGAHPDSHGLLGATPPRPLRRRPKKPELGPAELLLRPSLLDALDLEAEAHAALPEPPLDADPGLGGSSGR